MRIGLVIEKLRKKNNLNQKEFSALIGVTQTYISMIESEKKIPSFSVLSKISDVFLIPIPVIYMLAIEDKDVHYTCIDKYVLRRSELNALINHIFNCE